MKRFSASAMLAFIMFISAAVIAEERHIHVNGEHLSDEDIQLLDLVWQKTVPNAFYWINQNTGEWGFEGDDTVHGIIAMIAKAAELEAQQRQNPGSTQETINSSQNGSVVSGRINGQNCTYASAGGMTVKTCD